MNWLCSLIVFQYTILFLQGRPETSSTSLPEKITLELEHPSSVSAIITTLGSQPSSGIVSADTKKHLTATVAVAPPSQTTKRIISTAFAKKAEPTKKATKLPELVTFPIASSTEMDLISKTTRVIDELSTKQKSLLTTTPKAETEAAATTLNAEKPTIYEIISATEKNQTQYTSRAQPVTSSTQSSPLALPLSSQMPIENQRSGDTPKAIGHHVEMHHNNGHPGIAEPLTWQQLESEMSIVDQSLKESSTSKDGISTWILLSGSDKQQQMMVTPSTTTVSHVEKFDVQDKLNDRPNFRFGEVHGDKQIKTTKIRDSSDKKPKPDKKNKISSTTKAPPLVTKTTPMHSTSGIILASDFMNEKNRRKTPLANINKVMKRKTTTSTEIPSSEKISDTPTAAEEVEITTPVSFVELEPKDANFDLPQDRSPGSTPSKKPQKPVKQTKKKPAKKNKVTAVTKQPAKKDKPISTTIYNYLSREVMPSVGILGAGILLTAGLASYIFGPFGTLRRSYDDASDRQDNIDNIYSVNNEEYASEGSDSGQHEEEVFSKFLAGMPSRDVPRYVKYFKPDAAHPNQPNPANQPNHVMPANYPYRQQVRLQQQSSNVVPKYSPYMRYRMAPSPHYNTAQYNPQQQYSSYRNHQVSTQPATQPQIVSPVYNPQFHDMQKQKSFTNNMDTILKHQTTIYGKTVPNSDASENANVIEEKSIGTQILAETEAETPPQAESLMSDVTEQQQEAQVDEVSAQIQRRTNVPTYVVGSSITDTQPGVAVVSASMTASVDGLPSKGIVEPGVITVTASSHGPRRRRRRNTESVTQNPSNESTNKPTEHEKPEIAAAAATTTTTPAAPIQNTRLYSSSELSSLTSEYNMLNEKIMSFDRDYTNEEKGKKIEKKIQTEFKSIIIDYEALNKAIDGAKAIEEFEKQAHIRAKNYELSVILKTGITTLRQRIKQLNDLVEHPEDERIIEKINRRDGSNGTTNLGPSTNATTTTTTTDGQPAVENGFVGFLKLLQLKAQFGLNILQNIRPSFERAFEEVFKKPYEKPN